MNVLRLVYDERLRFEILCEFINNIYLVQDNIYKL